MAKRRAPEDLDAMEGVTSPAPKKQKNDGRGELLNGQTAHDERIEREANEDGTRTGTTADEDADAGAEEEEDDDDDEDDTSLAGPIRQAAPTAGYDDLYLDSIDRQVLDFDFEKLCSVSLSHINVYACLVCGRYYQGRGPKSHAYFHALDEGHHVFINMQTQRVYVLPEGYEVLSRSLDDIKFVADPRYTRSDVAQLDRRAAGSKICYTLAGKPYTPGFVGMNNIKENDYLNVVVQALAHVPPLRNFLLLDEFAASTANHTNAELVKRFGLLVRKIWNPRAFKAHVSPHELLQEVALRSNRRFTLTAQADPVDFLTWFLNHLHLGLGGSRTRPGSSIVQRVFQGKVRVESEKLEAVGASAAAAAAAKAAETGGYQQPPPPSSDAMMIDTPLPVRPGGMPPPPPPGMASHPLHHQQQQHHHQPPPPGVGAPGQGHFAQPPPPPPPGVSSGSGMFSMPPPSRTPPGVPRMGSSTLPPPPSSLPPPPAFSSQQLPDQGQQPPTPPQPMTDVQPVPSGHPKPTVDINRFLLLTLDLPPAPLFQDEQERNIIPQVPLTTLLGKYDGQSAQSARVDQADVRRRFQLQGPLPPYLILHMKRFSVNKFITERNPTIVTFDPRGLDMRPYVEGSGGSDSKDGDDAYLYDLVANVVHEAERARGDDVAVDSAEERRTWKVQLRDRSGATTTAAAATSTSNGATPADNGEDKWVVAQDLFVEPVAGELLYLAESYIQIWERRRRPGSVGSHGVAAAGKGKAKARPAAAAASTNGAGKGKA